MTNTPLRRTKIVATLGPATDAPGMLEKIIAAGVNVARLNLSHGAPDDHRARANAVREAAAKIGVEVGILADLQGPRSGSRSSPTARCSSRWATRSRSTAAPTRPTATPPGWA